MRKIYLKCSVYNFDIIYKKKILFCLVKNGFIPIIKMVVALDSSIVKTSHKIAAKNIAKNNRLLTTEKHHLPKNLTPALNVRPEKNPIK